MNELIQKITEWPVIIQGALGSLLCVAFLYLGKILIRFISKHIITFGKKQKRDRLMNESIRLKIIASNDPATSALCFITLIYFAFGEVVKALLLFSFGSFLDSFVPVFGSIGYIFSIYYLLKAAYIVRDTEVNDEKEANEIRAGIDKQIKALDENKS